METLLVRLKPYDHRRGYVLRRFTYAGIKFQPERGWYRVEKPVGEYLRSVRQLATDEHSPLAFDVCTDAEAATLEARDAEAAKVKHNATDELKLTPARTGGTLTTQDLSKAAQPTQDHSKAAPPAATKEDDRDPRRGKRERD